MRIVDCHTHWYPKEVFDALRRRKGLPPSNFGEEWHDLDLQLSHMDEHGIDVVCSAGVSAERFCDIPAADARDACRQYNDEMAEAHLRHRGRLWAAAVAPLQDTDMAIEVLEQAVIEDGLIGVSLPGRVSAAEAIDARRLEPFYARVAELGVPLFLHPTDATFRPILTGYGGAMHDALGRVLEVSVTAYRLVLSGIMERHPTLKVFCSHTGGALPYQAGRMDKNSGAARLPKPPSTYLKRIFTDTVSPHSMGLRFAIEFFGVDQVMYGSDYPCWNTRAALDTLGELGLSAEDQAKVMGGNARTLFGLDQPAKVSARGAVAA